MCNMKVESIAAVRERYHDELRLALRAALEESAWSVTRAARILGTSKAQVYRLMSRYPAIAADHERLGPSPGKRRA